MKYEKTGATSQFSDTWQEATCNLYEEKQRAVEQEYEVTFDNLSSRIRRGISRVDRAVYFIVRLVEDNRLADSADNRWTVDKAYRDARARRD